MVMFMRTLQLLTVLLAPIVLVGCGGVKYGEVRGVVTYRDKPLTSGTVTFWPRNAGGNPSSAHLQPDGSYSVSVAVGEADVTVETISASGKVQTGIPGGMEGKTGKVRPGGPPPEVMAQIRESMEQSGTKPVNSGPAADYVKIDAKFGNPRTSGFMTTVQTGEQEFNIPIK